MSTQSNYPFHAFSNIDPSQMKLGSFEDAEIYFLDDYVASEGMQAADFAGFLLYSAVESDPQLSWGDSVSELDADVADEIAMILEVGAEEERRASHLSGVLNLFRKTVLGETEKDFANYELLNALNSYRRGLWTQKGAVLDSAVVCSHMAEAVVDSLADLKLDDRMGIDFGMLMTLFAYTEILSEFDDGPGFELLWGTINSALRTEGVKEFESQEQLDEFTGSLLELVDFTIDADIARNKAEFISMAEELNDAELAEHITMLGLTDEDVEFLKGVIGNPESLEQLDLDTVNLDYGIEVMDSTVIDLIEEAEKLAQEVDNAQDILDDIANFNQEDEGEES